MLHVASVFNAVQPRVGPGAIPAYPFTSPLPHLLLYFLVSFTFPFFPLLLHLFFCFSIPSHSTRIVPICFQAGCRRRRLNLSLVLLCCFCVKCIFQLMMHAWFCRIWFSFVLPGFPQTSKTWKSQGIWDVVGKFLWLVTWFATCLSIIWSLHVRCKLN